MATGNSVIGALRVVLGLDTAQFDAGIKKTQASLKGLNFASLSGAAVGAAAIGGLTTAFVALRNAMQFGDDIADTAKRLAVTTDALQEYRYAVHQLGGDYADADKALEGFSKAFGAAHAGLTKKAAKPFEALGLDPKQFESTEAAFDAVIKKIAGLKSTAEQAAIADKLGIGDMLPAIREGGDAIDALRKKAHDLGFVMKEDVVNNLGDANDKFEDTEKILKNKLNTALAELIPTATTLATEIANIAEAVGDLLGRLNDLNKWAASKNLTAMFDWANQYGATLGKTTGLDQVGPTFARLGNNVPDVTAAQIAAKLGKKPPPTAAPDGELTSPTGGSKGPRDRSADAIAAAARDELRARQDLTHDIEALAKLRADEIDAELADANRQAREDAAEGSITKAAADAVIASNERTASLKHQALDIETAGELAREELDLRDQIGGYLGRTANAQADLAGTAEERNRIEASDLAREQKLERDKLAADQQDERLRAGLDEAALSKLDSDQKAAKAALLEAQGAERAANARNAIARVLEEQAARAKATLDLQVELLSGQADFAQSAYARVKIEEQILDLQQAEERHHLEQVVSLGKLAGYTDDEVAAAQARLAVLPKLHAQQQEQLRVGETLIDSYNSLADSIEGMTGAFKSGDIIGGLNNLSRSLKELSGMPGISKGLGSALSSLSTTASGFAAFGSIAKAITGSSFGLVGKLLEGKPSNKGAGFDLNTGALSGKNRDAKTEAAATDVGKEILKAQAALKKLGATLTSTVSGVVIGTRDATQIYLSNGKTLTSAIGDTGAATETALRAVLEAAEFADQAQKELVKSMFAAGESADAVISALSDAADEAKAKAEDIANKRRSLEIELMEAQGDALGALNARRADEKAALEQLDPALAKLQQSIYDARDLASLGDEVSAARDREADAIQRTIDKAQAFADRLRELQTALRADALKRGSPQAQRAALLRDLQNTASLADQGDEDAQARLPAAIEAFREASKNAAATTEDLARDEALIRMMTADALKAALDQVNNGKFQLEAMNKQVDILLGIDRKLLTLNEAIQAFLAKKATISTTPAAGGSLAGYNAGQVAAYGAANPDVVAAYAAYANGTSPYQEFFEQGLTLDEFLAAHLKNTGQAEIAAGLRAPGFATGGFGRVGGTGGIDSQLVRAWASPGEFVSVSHIDPGRAMRAANDEQMRVLKDIARDSRSSATVLKGAAYGARPIATS